MRRHAEGTSAVPLDMSLALPRLQYLIQAIGKYWCILMEGTHVDPLHRSYRERRKKRFHSGLTDTSSVGRDGVPKQPGINRLS